MHLSGLDACQSKPCHKNATCKMDFKDNTFLCKCNKDFEGDGRISCSKIIEKEVVRTEKELDCKDLFALIIIFFLYLS